jgi:Ca-activated chloride channel family protein
MRTIIHTLPAAVLTLGLFTAFAPAESPSTAIESARRINRANDKVHEGYFDEAVEIYLRVPPTKSSRDPLNYNLAVARFLNGDVKAAKTLFVKSAKSDDSRLAAKSRFNLGNCFHAESVALAEHDRPAAIDLLRQAITHYRSVLNCDPHQVDARANIEISARLIQELEQDQQQQDQQQQDQQQQDQQQQDQQQQDQQQGEESFDSSSANPGEIESQEKETRNASDSQGTPDDPNRNPTESSGGGTKNEGLSETGDEGTDETLPAGELTVADDSGAEDRPDGRVAVNDPDAHDGLMTREEALKMLQAVRDRDMLRRLKHEQAQRSRHVTVERDW